MQRHIQSVLPSRPHNWPHPAALTSPLSALSAFRLYANKGSGWREGESETCFVIKCTQHLSRCCLLMFRVPTLERFYKFSLLWSMSIKDDCKKKKVKKIKQKFCRPNFTHRIHGWIQDASKWVRKKSYRRCDGEEELQREGWMQEIRTVCVHLEGSTEGGGSVFCERRPPKA